MDYWHDDHLEETVEAYRSSRDPAPLTRLILTDPDAMLAPAIGRLFLDIINGRLPKLTHRASSTSDIRARAKQLVIFYLGQGLKKTKAFEVAGLILKKSGDRIEDYINDWLKDFTLWGWPDDVITETEFWANPEKYLGETLAFRDGRAMIDDELARNEIARLPHMDVAWYRKALTDSYENQKPFECDPWETKEKIWLLEQELKHLKDD